MIFSKEKKDIFKLYFIKIIIFKISNNAQFIINLIYYKSNEKVFKNIKI